MIDVSEVVVDLDLAQPFTIRRYKTAGTFADEGTYVPGATEDTDSAAPAFGEGGFGDQDFGGNPLLGVVTPSRAADIVNFLPEGERQKSSITVYSPVQLLMSDGKGQQSDLIYWPRTGQVYRVAFSKNWSASGYWFVMAVEL